MLLLLSARLCLQPASTTVLPKLRTEFSPPVLITPAANTDWLTAYADGGVSLSDDNLLWQTTSGRGDAVKYGSPVYRSTDKGSSWQQVFVHDQEFIVSPIVDPRAPASMEHALRGWGQLAADPCSPNGTGNPNDLAQVWRSWSSSVCWQVPCEAPVTFGVDANSGAFVATNHTGGPLSIDLGDHEVWCYNRSMLAPAMVLSVSGNTPLQDGSWLQTLTVFWGGGLASPDIPGAAGSPQHPQSWGNFSECSNINGRVPKDWTPSFPQSSIIVLRATTPFISWRLHGVIANASDYPCSTEGPSEHDIVALADGRLMAVFRTDGGDGHGWQPYSQTFSEDDGRSWSPGKMMANGLTGVNGTARPRLLRLKSGPVLLAGGRYTKDPARWTTSWGGRISWEPAVWVNYKGDGVDWEMHSISYQHNLLEPNSTLHFTTCVNDTGPSCAPICAPNCKITRTSSAYTSILATSDNSAVITYDHLPPPCMGTCTGDSEFACKHTDQPPASRLVVSRYF